jgi:mxaA protein
VNAPVRFTAAAIVAALLALAVPAARADVVEPIVHLDRVEPRPFGFVIGDTLTRRIELDTAAGTSIDRERLPKPGRVSSWLELVDVTVEARAGNRHELALTYQIFNSAPEVRTRPLPAVDIPLKTVAGTAIHTVPKQLFTTGPLTPEYVSGRDGLAEMRPDAKAPPLSTVWVRLRLALWTLGLVAIALYFLYAYRGLPFLTRSRGPFARALRAVDAAVRGGDEQAGRRAALQALHRAFDETARGTVFGEHLDRFFAAHARYASLRPQVERFFAGSQQEFFGSGATELSLAWLASLTRELRDRERGVA